MGMLDDAIREHLELKRLRGADPGDVAREEDEALGPVRREVGQPADAATPPEDLEGDRSAGSGSVFEMPQAPEGEEEPSANNAVGQETVEIDMEQALADESARPESGPSPRGAGRAAPVGHPAHTASAAENSLEWEMPGDQADGEAKADGDAEQDEAVEDVLEETPEFLRETPEHERLWFEQRPPRDFDFNE